MIVTQITEQQFDEKILNVDGITVARFFGGWCGPCKMESTILSQINDPRYDTITMYDLDVDKCPLLTHRYGVMTVPTLIIFKDGAELEKIAGFRNQKQLEEIFDRYCNLEK